MKPFVLFLILIVLSANMEAMVNKEYLIGEMRVSLTDEWKASQDKVGENEYWNWHASNGRELGLAYWTRLYGGLVDDASHRATTIAKEWDISFDGQSTKLSETAHFDGKQGKVLAVCLEKNGGHYRIYAKNVQKEEFESLLSNFSWSRQGGIDQTKAAEVATQFLKQNPKQDEYIHEVDKVFEKPDYWEFWFKHKKSSRPSHGVIQVNKKTGEARWIPQR